MKKHEIRRLNLIHIRDQVFKGNAAKLAQALDVDATFVRRCFYEEGKAQRKNIGDETVDRILNAFSLPPGWLDVPQWEHELTLEHGKIFSTQKTSGLFESIDSISNSEKPHLSAEQLTTLLRNFRYLPFVSWSKIANIPAAVKINILEYKQMLIDVSSLKEPISEGAFVLKLDTENFGDHFPAGTKIIFNPYDGIPPKKDKIVLVSFSDGHKTLARYKPLANKLYLELLEKGYPPTLEVTPETKYSIAGVAILESHVKAL